MIFCIAVYHIRIKIFPLFCHRDGVSAFRAQPTSTEGRDLPCQVSSALRFADHHETYRRIDNNRPRQLSSVNKRLNEREQKRARVKWLNDSHIATPQNSVLVG